MRRLFLLVPALSLLHCGGGGDSPSTTPPASGTVSLTPATGSIVVGQARTLQAVLSGVGGPVTWSTTAGSITPSGDSLTATFLAPGAAGSATITASAGGKSATAILQVVADAVTGRVTPVQAFLNSGATQTFTFTQAGTGDNAAAWSVIETGGGTVSASGTYTAPTTPGLYHVAVQSATDPRLRAMATVYVANPATPNPAGTYTTVSPMRAARYRHAATNLPDGRVLIVGGTPSTTWAPHASTELFNPATNTFTDGPTMAIPRMNQSQALLPDGKILIAGGNTAPNATTPASDLCEIFDPGTNTLSATGSMTVPRSLASTTVLADGRVLVAGGFAGNVVLSSAEVYNPKTRTWSAVGSMTTSRIYHTATLMPDGRVLIAGGRMTGGNDTAAMDFFDPATNAFTAAGNLPVTSEFHAALPLPDGRALIIGGSGPGSTLSTLLAVGSTGVATKVGDLLQSRTGHQALYLGNGRICVITGYNSVYPPTEVVDLSTFLSTPHGNLATPRNYSPAFLLSNGKVFVAGGSGATVTSNGELFQ